MNCITCILIDDNDHQLLVIFQMKVSNGIWIIFLQLDDIEGAQNDTISAKTHCRKKNSCSVSMPYRCCCRPRSPMTVMEKGYDIPSNGTTTGRAECGLFAQLVDDDDNDMLRMQMNCVKTEAFDLISCKKWGKNQTTKGGSNN